MTIKKALSSVALTVITAAGISVASATDAPAAYPYAAIVDQYIQAWESKSMEGMKQIFDKDAIIPGPDGKNRKVLEVLAEAMSQPQGIHVKKIDLFVPSDLQANKLVVRLQYDVTVSQEEIRIEDMEEFILNESGKIVELDPFMFMEMSKGLLAR